jgi:hypothetical protein
MTVVMKIPLCLYGIQMLVINVDDCLLSQVHFLVIGGVLLNII